MIVFNLTKSYNKIDLFFQKSFNFATKSKDSYIIISYSIFFLFLFFISIYFIFINFISFSKIPIDSSLLLFFIIFILIIRNSLFLIYITIIQSAINIFLNFFSLNHSL